MDVPITYCPPGYAQGYSPQGITMDLPDRVLWMAGNNMPMDSLADKIERQRVRGNSGKGGRAAQLKAYNKRPFTE